MDEPTIPSFLEPDTQEDIPNHVDHRKHSRPDAQQGTVHSEETKALALAIYAETGSPQTASEGSGVPRTTVAYWVEKDPDIDAKLDALRRVLRERVAWKYARGAELAVDVVIDRLENGDEVIDKEGNSRRRPVPAREAAFIASIFSDKHALLAGTMAKNRPEDQALTTLAAELLKGFEAAKAKAKALGAACGGAAQIADAD